MEFCWLLANLSTDSCLWNILHAEDDGLNHGSTLRPMTGPAENEWFARQWRLIKAKEQATL